MLKIKRLIYIIYILIKYNLITLSSEMNFIKNLISKLSIFFFKEINKKNRGIRLKIALEKLGPLFIKLGQLLSVRFDIIPEDISLELTKLQTNTYICNPNIIRRYIKREIGLEINNIFKKFNANSIASGSIAQIYTGILINNKKVIIKIIKPGIHNIIKIDICILKILAYFLDEYFIKSERIKFINIITELQLMLKNELNLKKEAANSLKLKKNLDNIKYVYIPKVYWNLTTKNIIVFEFIEGINLNNKCKLKQENFNVKVLSKNLIEIFYIQTFKHKFFHADLHPGNIIVNKKKSGMETLTFIDFGIVSSLSNNEKLYLTNNILAFSQKDYKKVAYLHIKTGNMIGDINELEKEICFMCEPIINKPSKEISFKHTILLMIEISKKFKMRTQPKLILFQKTLITLEGLVRKINPDINLWKITRQSIEKIIVSKSTINELSENFINRLNNIIKNNEIKSINDKIEIDDNIILFLLYYIIFTNIITIFVKIYGL